MKTNKPVLAFVRCCVDNVGTIDVRVSDYLARFYTATYVIGFFNCSGSVVYKARPVRIHMKPLRIPFLQGFIISLIALFKLVKIKPNTVLWTWGCFFPGGFLLKLAYPRTKVFVDVRSHPISQRSKLVTAVYDGLFIWTLRTAEKIVDGLTIISSSMRVYISKRYGVSFRKKSCVWSSGYDKDLFEHVQSVGSKYVGLLRKILGVEENDRVLIYYGTISYSRLPLFRLLIETVNLLKGDYSDIKLLLIGKGDAVQEVRSLVRSFNLEKEVILVPAISHAMIPLVLTISDIVISPFPRNHNWLTQVPLKVIEALGMKKPIVTTPLIELRRLLPPEYLVDFETLSPAVLKCKIKELFENKTYANISKNIDSEKLSWNHIAERLYRCIEGPEV